MLYSSLHRAACAALCGLFALGAYAVITPQANAFKVDATIYNLSGHILTLKNADVYDYPFSGHPPFPQYSGEYPDQMKGLFTIVPTRASKRILPGSVGRVRANWQSSGLITLRVGFQSSAADNDLTIQADTRGGIKPAPSDVFSVVSGVGVMVTKRERITADRLHVGMTVRSARGCLSCTS